MKQAHLRHSPLCGAIAVVMATIPLQGLAVVVPIGQSVVVDGASQAPGAGDSWTVQGRLDVINGGRAGSISARQGQVFLDGAVVTAASPIQTLRSTNGAIVSVSNSSVTNTNIRGSGLILASDSGDGFGIGGTARVSNGSVIRGGRFGMSVGANGSAEIDASSVASTAAGADGANLLDGRVVLTNGASITGQRNGLSVTANVTMGQVDHGRALTVDGSIIEGLDGSAITLSNLTDQPSTTLDLRVGNGSQLIGSDHVMLRMDDDTSANMTIGASDLVGDIVMAERATATVNLGDHATWTGRIDGAAKVGVAGGARWNLTGDAAVASLDLSEGTVAFAPANALPSALTVRGDFTGTGGALVLNTVAGAGGPLASQFTDRLLIHGDVSTTGTTVLDVNLVGDGASTDLNHDDVVSPNEGISLVQVSGSSRADAFALRGGYVAAGPWQYTLHAFGPGTTDAAQNVLASGALNWDYRLASREVCEKDCGGPGNPDPEGPGPGNPDPEGPNPGNPDPGTPGPVNPEPGTPGPVNPDPGAPGPVDPEPGAPDPGTPGPGAGGGDSSNSRVAVVPQVPSYLSAPAALMTYGDMLSDGLHQRLGDIRNGKGAGDIGGEVFARYVGGQYRYSSNRNFQQYGYDFDQQVNALQLGGSILAIVGEASTLRAGWAIDKGTTRVTPKAADGESHAKYDANGVSAWLTWSSDNGFYVDGVVGNTRYTGDIGTAMRGNDVARIHANAWHASVEAGYPLALGANWTLEPQLQVKHQALTFRDFRDTDDLDVRLGTVRQTTSRVGAMLTRTADIRFMPYARIDLSHTSNGVANTKVSSEAFNVSDTFASGRVGNAWRGSLGVVSQLTPHVQLYGEGNYQHFVGTFGMRGWSANAGIRVSF